MGNRREHHYIPQFYLRNFSTDNEKSKIGIYNLNNSVFSYKAQIRHQAKEKLFYGNDDIVESGLGNLESKVSHLIRDLIEKHLTPETDTIRHPYYYCI